MKVEHHNFYSDDGGREAVVFKYNEEDAWYVDLWEANVLLESRKMQTDGVLHSEQYAEDCAENWVLYVFDVHA